MTHVPNPYTNGQTGIRADDDSDNGADDNAGDGGYDTAGDDANDEADSESTDNHSDNADGGSDDDLDNDGDDSESNDEDLIDLSQPHWTDVVRNANGQPLLTLQHSAVREVVSSAIKRIEGHLMFKSTFPESDPRTKAVVIRNALAAAASDIDREVQWRILHDSAYERALKTHVSIF